MRKTLLFLMLLCANVTFAQFQDDFTDGDFTTNPTWLGNSSLFNVNASKQLQSNGLQLANQTFSLATPNLYAKNAVWEFFIQLNFDPTTTNFPRVYLVSNQQDLTGSLNGYFFQIGQTGAADGFNLYRQNGTSTTQIITGADKARANTNLVSARIKITRDDNGKWELYSDVSGGTNYTLEGSVTDNTHTTTSYFGVYCKYATTSRYNQFIFDDFKVSELVPDVTPPTLVDVKTIDDTNLEVTFSEALQSTGALNIANYALSNYGNPASISATSSSVYKLTYANPISSGNYTLTVNNVNDLKGNTIAGSNTKTFLHIKSYTAQKGDVVINEIFADPTPQIGLPGTEFIELWNTTNEYVSLKGWKYSDPTATYTFGNEIMLPNSYLILCANADVATYSTFGKTLGISPWPTLNNDKDILKLINQNATTIDEVAYKDTWYKDDVKKAGGYSLELIDPKNRCKDIQNWMASTATTGGTPGQQNAVYQNQMSMEAPRLLSSTVVDPLTIRLQFSKYVDSLVATIPANYTINNGVGSPVSVLPLGPTFTTVELTLSAPLTKGIENLITVNNLTDCAGNLINPTANNTSIFLAKDITKGDILISEVLFNPKGTGVDYVEVYNNTDHILDLKDLQIANIDNTGSTANIKTVSTQSVFIPSKKYWVLTANPTNIKEQYKAEFPDQFVQLSSIPSYNNDKGTVILLSGQNMIDRFDYTEKMHFSLLKDVDGISLERSSFIKDANEPGNFKSAAAAVGFGTPTYANSQLPDETITKNAINLESKTFSPDGDGFEDGLKIDYQLRESGSLATVNIYTDKGALVRKLARNTTVSTTGNFVWDGLNDAGQMCKIGIYVIKFDVFSLNGKTDTFTKSCVLASKLN